MAFEVVIKQFIWHYMIVIAAINYRSLCVRLWKWWNFTEVPIYTQKKCVCASARIWHKPLQEVQSK